MARTVHVVLDATLSGIHRHGQQPPKNTTTPDSIKTSLRARAAALPAPPHFQRRRRDVPQPWQRKSADLAVSQVGQARAQRRWYRSAAQVTQPRGTGRSAWCTSTQVVSFTRNRFGSKSSPGHRWTSKQFA